MLDKWIEGLAKIRWWIIAFWAAAVVASVTLLPDLKEVVSRTESRFVPESAESMQAKHILERLQPDLKTESNAIAVFIRPEGLTEADLSWLRAKADAIRTRSAELGVASVLSAFDAPAMADKFTSKDGTSSLLAIGLPGKDQDEATHKTVDALSALLEDHPSGTLVHLTGSAPINKDFTKSSQDGLKKTELLTVVLVLGILLFVFRSPLAPLVPLLTIGLSLVITRGLVAWAAGHGMPVSNFTESFLIAVLFGAGTDYCILLIQRFREELVHGADSREAMARTLRTVGRTVLFSGSTVFIAFFLIGFAEFGLYRSAVGVSIGMAATLLAGLTLTPAILLLLGPRLFWPVKIRPGQGHGESRVWGALGGWAAKRPIALLLATVVALAPVILLFDGKRSFDDVAEINPTLGAVAGFQAVKDKFGVGEVFPVTAALSSPAGLRTPEGLYAMEQAAVQAARMPGVKEVRGATRPLGSPLLPPERLKQLPAEALSADPGLKSALDFYMSPDGKTAKLEVVLDTNPYSNGAMDLTTSIRTAVRSALTEAGVPEGTEVKLAGTTAQYAELKEISRHDFLRTGGLVLLGIFLVIAVLLRSWAAPLYLLLSLVFNYFITMGLLEFIFVRLLDYPGLSWTVSFFVFLIIVALGVDYGIFLLARFKEESAKGSAIPEAMRKAMSTTGGVILSAAVIMGGTFAALMMSGVDTLVQIGAGILIGLALYSTVFMGLFVPAAANAFGRLRFRRTTAAAQPSVPQAEAHPEGAAKPLLPLQRPDAPL